MNLKIGDAVKVFKGRKLVDAGRVLDMKGLVVGTKNGHVKVNGNWVELKNIEAI